MCSGAGHTTCLVRGSPIRTPSDQRSVGSSPRLIAASHVLHRLLMPRHPPCALNNLTKHHTTQQNTGATTHERAATPEIKMLASTVQFSTNNQPPPPTTPPTRTNVERSETGMALSEEHRPARRPASAGPRTG